MEETMEKKVLPELLREIELEPAVLEKIGFASRAFDIFRAFDVIPFGKSKYEDFFCLACLAASLVSGDKETEIENGRETIEFCLELSCGMRENKTTEEIRIHTEECI